MKNGTASSNHSIEELFKRESYLERRKLNDNSKLGLGFRINPVDMPSYFYLVLLKHQKKMEYGPRFEQEKEAYETYHAISSREDFKKC